MLQALRKFVRQKTCPVAATAMLLVLCGTAVADPLVTDRPDFTESALSVAPRHVQLEGGYTFARTGAEESHAFGELLARVGLFQRMEARIGINSFASVDNRISSYEGFEDSYLGVKVELAAGTSSSPFTPAVALIAGSSLPTGASSLTADEAEPEAKLCLAWSLTESAGLAANLNAASLAGENGRFLEFSGSVSVATAISDAAGGYIEWFGFVQERKYGPNRNYLNGGLTFLINDDLQLDGRAGAGLNTISPDYFVGAGIARRF